MTDNKIVASLLLFSKELIERRTQIESAFKLRKKAFVVVATALMELLEDSSGYGCDVVDGVRNAVKEVSREILPCDRVVDRYRSGSRGDSVKSYASVATVRDSKVQVRETRNGGVKGTRFNEFLDFSCR